MHSDDLVPFPQVHHGLEDMLKIGATAEQQKIAANVLQIFLRQAIRSSSMYNQAENGESVASFPWNVVSLAQLAKEIFTAYGGNIVASKADVTDLTHQSSKRTFMMVSTVSTKDGHQFDFVENVVHELMKRLPRALEHLAAGREPEDLIVYTLGNPANEQGKVSASFQNNVQADPFGAYGKLYAAFIEEQLKQDAAFEGARRKDIEVYGTSMGASFAAATAAELLRNGIAEQSGNRGNKPQLHVKLIAPVAINQSALHAVQVIVGYLIDGVLEQFKAVVRTNNKHIPAFNDAVKSTTGFRPQMDPEQAKRKNLVIRDVIWGLMKGREIDPTLRTNIVTGTADLTMTTPGFALQAAKQQKKSPDSLGAYTVPVQGASASRQFAIKMMHVPPFMRENELKRWQEVARYIETMQKNVSAP